MFAEFGGGRRFGSLEYAPKIGTLFSSGWVALKRSWIMRSTESDDRKIPVFLEIIKTN